jgi:hypothetical protein
MYRSIEQDPSAQVSLELSIEYGDQPAREPFCQNMVHPAPLHSVTNVK